LDAKTLLQELDRCLKDNIPVALATVTSVSGSAPGRVGAKMLIYENGSIKGSVGGGCLEAAVIEEAKYALDTKKPRCSDYNLDKDDAAGLGMVCGGKITVFIEPWLSEPELIIVGAGHISQYLAHLAKLLSFRVVVIDDREDFANPERFPETDNLIVDDIEQALSQYKLSPHHYIVIVTRGHQFDESALEQVISSDAAYIGMIGSRKKIKTIYDNLQEKGISTEQLEKVYAPIGLKLGGNSPAEVALSIAAQLVQIRHQS